MLRSIRSTLGRARLAALLAIPVLAAPATASADMVLPQDRTFTVYNGNGFKTYSSTYPLRDIGRYTLRLTTTVEGNVEQFRDEAVEVARQVRLISGVDIVVAEGTVPDHSTDREPVRGEIILSIDSTPPSPCDVTDAGCGGPRMITPDHVRQASYVESGRVWINRIVTGYTASEQLHVMAHEIGHALGLEHFNELHDGAYQVMNDVRGQYTDGRYRSGDSNGLRYLHPDGDGDRFYDDPDVYRDGSVAQPDACPSLAGVGGDGCPSAPSATVTGSATAYVFWRGQPDAAGNAGLWQALGDARNNLSGPYQIGMSPLGSPPAATIDANGATYVYWRAANGNLYEAYWDSSLARWVGPVDLRISGLTSQPSAVISNTGTAYVFWRGTDGGLWQAQGNPRAGLGPAQRIPLSLRLGSAPTAGIDHAGNTYVYWRGTDATLTHAYWDGSRWVGSVSHGMGPLGSTPSVIVNRGKAGGVGGVGAVAPTAYVFWRGVDGHLYQAMGNPRNRLSGPYYLGMGLMGSAPSAGIDSSGNTYVYWKSNDLNLIEGFYNGSVWVGWFNRGMGPMGA